MHVIKQPDGQFSAHEGEQLEGATYLKGKAKAEALAEMGLSPDSIYDREGNVLAEDKEDIKPAEQKAIDAQVIPTLNPNGQPNKFGGLTVGEMKEAQAKPAVMEPAPNEEVAPAIALAIQEENKRAKEAHEKAKAERAKKNNQGKSAA